MPNTKATTLMLLISVLSACATSDRKPEAPKLTATGTPVLHAIDNQELRLLMARMNNLMFERNLTDQEMDKHRQEALGRVLAAANGLDQAVDGILAAEPKLRLDSGEDRVFRSLAVNLRGEAQTLKAQAEAQQTDDIPATLEKMTATCNACHELFRDFAKPGVQK